MHIALINAAEVEMSPYIRTYMEILDKCYVNYTVIEWRRDLPPLKDRSHIISFNYHSPIKKSRFLKIKDYWRFARFIKKVAHRNSFSKLIIFDYQTAFFLSRWLKKYYTKKYILDIRDYNSIMPYIKRSIQEIDNHLFARVISSPYYNEWLNPVANEVVCHNTTLQDLSFANYSSFFPIKDDKITILTLGNLRTYSIDVKIVNIFSSQNNIRFLFAGKGKESHLYENLAKSNSMVEYSGKYDKAEEMQIAKRATFINIFLEDNISYNTAFSNRFYLSVICGIPMIVNSQNAQSKFVKKYNLGIVASSIDELPDQLNHYISAFDCDRYNKGRKDMIDLIKRDISNFNQLIESFVKL